MSRDITPADVDPVMFAPQRTRGVARVIFAIAVLFSAFQVYTSAFAPLSSVVIRALHVSFLMLLTFAMFPSSPPNAPASSSAGPTPCGPPWTFRSRPSPLTSASAPVWSP